MHAYAQQGDSEPSETIQLVKIILLARSKEEAKSTSEAYASCSEWSSVSEGFTPVTNIVDVGSCPTNVDINHDKASGMVVNVDGHLAISGREIRNGL